MKNIYLPEYSNLSLNQIGNKLVELWNKFEKKEVDTKTFNSHRRAANSAINKFKVKKTR
jgi:hypothetical protein